MITLQNKLKCGLECSPCITELNKLVFFTFKTLTNHPNVPFVTLTRAVK